MLPLTQLTEDEQMLKEATADFAQSSIAPLVQKMDEQAKLEQSVIEECFEMGLMGVEIPEKTTALAEPS